MPLPCTQILEGIEVCEEADGSRGESCDAHHEILGWVKTIFGFDN
jgi:hypothetical protein